jgi:DNA-binding NtrC family response regulator
MSRFTHKFSTPFFSAAILVVTLALFLSVINTATNTVTASNDQVPWTATGSAVITNVTKLPGGLTQLDGATSGTATHLGNFTGPATRIQNHIFEREYLLAQVNRFGGNISRTAEFVGMERSALHRKLRALGVNSNERSAAMR